MDTYDTPIYDRQQEDDQLDHPSQTSAIRYEGDDCSRLQQRPLAASVYTEPAARGQLARYELPNLGRLEPNLYGRQDKQLDPFDQSLYPESRLQRQQLHSAARLTLLPRSSSFHNTRGSRPMYGSNQRKVTSVFESSAISYRSPVASLPSNDQDLLGYISNPRSPSLNHSLSFVGRNLSSSPSFRGPDSPSYEISQRRNQPGTRQPRVFRGNDEQSFRVTPAHSLPTKAYSGRAPCTHALPVVQGILLVSLNELPDRFRSVFPFPIFNAIQSKCYQTAYKTNNNLVVSAPTGSGKTAVLEIAICHLVSNCQSGQFKIIYMAPTKSLCSERQKDWQQKFAPLDLQCAELTGDTDQAQLWNVQNASIIITTPEKWDSMTRKWKDHAKLMELVKLFLIDEVHILKDARGATLEAVVSRMKSIGSSVRFIALSATVPNSDDVATWLGKDHTEPTLPAQREKFGEDFRPVKLQKYVYGLPFRGNDFAFETVCDQKLPDVIAKHCERKPMMVFCFTRKSTFMTAKFLTSWWSGNKARSRYWDAPLKAIAVSDPELKHVVSAGVAFHHAGLDSYDRQAVENGFLAGQISVICCTSTLAVGVNLPCHLVIIKNTVSWQDEGVKEYADLEMMQMLGRAGRPQFDDSAAAVIITKQDKVKKYEKLVSGEELLESCLHLNLIDHLNAEIGLGTVHDLHTAKRWLAGTFLYVRLARNPNHYKLDGDATGRNLDDQIAQICERDISLLRCTDLVRSGDHLKCTEFGDAMARYYVKFDTMRILLDVPTGAKMSEILSALCQAEEFHEVRFRSGEKTLYKLLNSANGMRFPINVDIALSAQKRSIIIQSELGGIDYPTDEQYLKHRKQYQQDKAILFSHIHRLVRCVIDCQLHRQDAPAARHALELARSLGARVWDNSPLQMKQVPLIGIVAVRKLAVAGINSLEALEEADAQRIEMILSKNLGFGSKILASLKAFPKLRVSLKLIGKDVKSGRPVNISIKADLGFLNDKNPALFNRKPIYVCFLAERSDGHLVDFRRMSANKLNNGQTFQLSSELSHQSQYITCYVMCDQIAGTLRYAELKPNFPATMFPSAASGQRSLTETKSSKPRMNISRRRTTTLTNPDIAPSIIRREDEEFPDDNIDDQDMMAAVDQVDFSHVETFEPSTAPRLPYPKVQNAPLTEHLYDEGEPWEPQRLQNGKWACNHKCKDKTACKHMCCRDGTEKAPKAPKTVSSLWSKAEPNQSKSKQLPLKKPGQSSLSFSVKQPFKQPRALGIEVVDLASDERRLDLSKDKIWTPPNGRKGVLDSTLARISLPKKPRSRYSQAQQLQSMVPLKVNNARSSVGRTPSDCGSSWLDDLPSPTALVEKITGPKEMLFLKSPRADKAASINEVEEDVPDLNTGTIRLDDPQAESEHDLGNIKANPPYHQRQPTGNKDNPPPQAASNMHIKSIQSPKLDDSHNKVSLFFGTSSPSKSGNTEENSEQGQKRELETETSITQESSLGQAQKRSRLMDDASIDALQLSIPRKRYPGLLSPQSKSNVFADMTGIDSDLLAEFADICEFVD